MSHLGTGPVAMFPVGLRAFGRMVGCGVMDSCGQRCGIPRDSAGNRPRAPAGVGSRPVGAEHPNTLACSPPGQLQK